MKKLVKNTIFFIYVYIYSKLRNLVRASSKGCHFCILVYHRINDQQKDSVTVSTDQFKKQIQFLKKNYDLFGLNELPGLSGKKLRRPMVAITFDDGYLDNFEAARFLSENKVPASFFVTTRIVGTDNPFPHDLKMMGMGLPTLSWDQVRQMASWGHIIGPHTAYHQNLSTLDVDQALEQVRMGQDDLFAQLGEAASNHLFAYPHGRKEDLAEEARKELPGLGIQFCLSAYGGVNFADFDPYDIRRQGIDHNFTPLAFRAALEGWNVRMAKRS